MRIAIPLSGGHISQHFGHCEQFLFVERGGAGTTQSHQARLLNLLPSMFLGLLPSGLSSMAWTS